MLPGPHTHAGVDTTEDKRCQLHGVPEGEEQSDDIRQVCEPEVQVWEHVVVVYKVF